MSQTLGKNETIQCLYTTSLSMMSYKHNIVVYLDQLAYSKFSIGVTLTTLKYGVVVIQSINSIFDWHRLRNVFVLSDLILDVSFEYKLYTCHILYQNYILFHFAMRNHSGWTAKQKRVYIH